MEYAEEENASNAAYVIQRMNEYKLPHFLFLSEMDAEKTTTTKKYITA